MTTFTGKSICTCKTPEHEKMLCGHGKRGAYQYHGCRCDECTAGNNARSKVWRDRNREKANASQRRRWAKNPDYFHAKSRRFREKHPEAAHRRFVRWKTENVDYYRKRHRDSSRKRRTLTRNQPGLVTGRYNSTEDAIVMRDDLSLMQIAFMLGRTYRSVSSRRHSLRKAS